jgi:hypothetical protein
MGLADLREQRFDEGWWGYEQRFDTRPPQAERRAISLPRYARASAQRERVAVWAEQGIGDQILFSTLLPQFRGDAHPVVEVDARLVEAYRRSVEGIEFVAPAASTAAFASCAAEIPLGSLASLYRYDRASFAEQPRALLRADSSRVDAIRRQLGEGRWIGVSWRSVQKGLRAGLAARKSIPLEAFARLAREAGARLVDLQYGDVDEDRRRFDAAHPGVRVQLEGLDLFGDLEGVLAAIEACDEVVTASNVTAHLAGALGKRATVVLPGGRSPFHYWDAVEGDQSLWYPSVRVANEESMVLLRGVEPPTY